ncbi:hypothetical protein ABZ341_18260 [Streptomyces sp. NPDC006173]|uniref:hypothetical protein n=1 Tax=Streptomyces sp. NPDC006173 TaxID=3155349 RepID=UPI0033E088D5
MPMHTGSADEYRDMERRALAIGQQIASLLNDLQQIAPGSVAANVSGLGFRIVRRGSGFTAIQDR